MKKSVYTFSLFPRKNNKSDVSYILNIRVKFLKHAIKAFDKPFLKECSGKSVTLNTGIKIDIDHWSDITKTLKHTHPEYSSKVAYISEYVESLTKSIETAIDTEVCPYYHISSKVKKNNSHIKQDSTELFMRPGYIKFYPEIGQMYELDIVENSIMSYVYSYNAQSKRFYVSKDKVAAKLGVSKTKVSRALSSLVKKNLLTKVNRTEYEIIVDVKTSYSEVEKLYGVYVDSETKGTTTCLHCNNIVLEQELDRILKQNIEANYIMEKLLFDSANVTDCESELIFDEVIAKSTIRTSMRYIVNTLCDVLCKKVESNFEIVDLNSVNLRHILYKNIYIYLDQILNIDINKKRQYESSVFKNKLAENENSYKTSVLENKIENNLNTDVEDTVTAKHINNIDPNNITSGNEEYKYSNPETIGSNEVKDLPVEDCKFDITVEDGTDIGYVPLDKDKEDESEYFCDVEYLDCDDNLIIQNDLCVFETVKETVTVEFTDKESYSKKENTHVRNVSFGKSINVGNTTYRKANCNVTEPAIEFEFDPDKDLLSKSTQSKCTSEKSERGPTYDGYSDVTPKGDYTEQPSLSLDGSRTPSSDSDIQLIVLKAVNEALSTFKDKIISEVKQEYDTKFEQKAEDRFFNNFHLIQTTFEKTSLAMYEKRLKKNQEVLSSDNPLHPMRMSEALLSKLIRRSNDPEEIATYEEIMAYNALGEVYHKEKIQSCHKNRCLPATTSISHFCSLTAKNYGRLVKANKSLRLPNNIKVIAKEVATVQRFEGIQTDVNDTYLAKRKIRYKKLARIHTALWFHRHTVKNFQSIERMYNKMVIQTVNIEYYDKIKDYPLVADNATFAHFCMKIFKLRPYLRFDDLQKIRINIISVLAKGTKINNIEGYFLKSIETLIKEGKCMRFLLRNNFTVAEQVYKFILSHNESIPSFENAEDLLNFQRSIDFIKARDLKNDLAKEHYLMNIVDRNRSYMDKIADMEFCFKTKYFNALIRSHEIMVCCLFFERHIKNRKEFNYATYIHSQIF